MSNTFISKYLDADFVKGEVFFLNLDLISGMKYVHLLINNILVKVGVLWTLFRSVETRVYPYNGSERGLDNIVSK